MNTHDTKIIEQFTLPDNLPVPENDGACDHLLGLEIPSIKLQSTQNRWIDVRQQSQKATVFFFYPRTGEAGRIMPEDWDMIPGARGCTPQSCAFKEMYEEFLAEGFDVFGVSSQSNMYQQEFSERMTIPFGLLSDESFVLTKVLGLPTFEYQAQRLIKRLAFITAEGKIIKFFYPVFPPNENAANVFRWIQEQKLKNNI